VVAGVVANNSEPSSANSSQTASYETARTTRSTPEPEIFSEPESQLKIENSFSRNATFDSASTVINKLKNGYKVLIQDSQCSSDESEELRSKKLELIRYTEMLLQAIQDADFETYVKLTDSSITCFEPEAQGQLIKGQEFHRFYFENGIQLSAGLGQNRRIQQTIGTPHITILSDDSALIAYSRIVQYQDGDGKVRTQVTNETRVWRRTPDSTAWICCHFHRSKVNDS